jgi:hypothetical protein
MLQTPTNVSVSIYRTANPGSPYTLGTLSASGVPGHLEPAAHDGRHGTASWLKWTHILYLAPTVDVRDAYNSQLDPSRNNALADTIILADTNNPATLTAFYVVFVEQVSRSTGASHLRVYLDRFAPNTWPTNAL